ncbi:hypothetical protein BH10ACT3_BH10ACT3_02780 [soil metagenome]
MTRWNVLGPVAAMALVMAAATACQPAPPPYYKASQILSFDITDAVVAGDDLTVSVTASDDVAVQAVSVAFTVPETVAYQYDGFSPATIITCDIPTFAAQQLVTVEFTCSTPDFAPNGTWTATVIAHDGGGPSYDGRATTTFDLSGGSDDVSPPTIVSYQAGPNPATVGDTVIYTIRVTDEHPLHFSYRSLTWQQRNSGWMYCDETARTVFAPNDVEVVFGCPVTDAPGEAHGTFVVRDILGNTLVSYEPIQVVGA